MPTTSAPLATLDVAIIGGYFVLVIFVGLSLSRAASRGVKDYFLGGRKIPWWILGASGSASNFDMTGTMVVTSFFYATGFQGFWVATRGGLCLSLVVVLAFMGRWLRRSKVVTTAEWMEFRFGRDGGGQAARLLSAAANLVFVVGMVVYFAKGTGGFLSIFLPFSPVTCSLFMISVGLIYTVLSGLYGVVYTDLFQEVMLLFVSGYLIFRALFLPDHAAVLAAAGPAWSAIAPQWIAEPMPWLSNPDIYHLFGVCIIFWFLKNLADGYSGFGGSYVAQRFYAAPTERAAGLMSVEWVSLLSMRFALVMGIALMGVWLSMNDSSAATLLHNNPEQTLPLVLSRILPAGIKGLAISGLIAASMSTFDSTINGGAAYWVCDIYQRYLRPQASEKELIKQSYWATFLIAVLGVVLALFVDNINQIWNWMTGPFGAGLFAPLVMRWYWWRFNGYGFAIGTAVGMIAAIAQMLAKPDLALYLSLPLTASASLIAGTVSSLLTPPVPREALERFYKQMLPFGFWGPLSSDLLSAEKRSALRVEHLRDNFNVVVAMGWQLCLFLGATTLVLRKWDAFTLSAAGTVIAAMILYFTWYRFLPAHED